MVRMLRAARRLYDPQLAYSPAWAPQRTVQNMVDAAKATALCAVAYAEQQNRDNGSRAR